MMIAAKRGLGTIAHQNLTPNLLHGGVMVSVFRLLAVFVFSSLMSGCYLMGKVNSLEADVKSFREYLRAIPPPNDCKRPGEAQVRVCYYRLYVEPFDDKHPGLFKGHVPAWVVEDGVKDCEIVRQKIKDAGNPEVGKYTCRQPYDYQHVWYGFKIKEEPDLKGEYDFINVPHTEFLKRGDKKEATVENPDGKEKVKHP